MASKSVLTTTVNFGMVSAPVGVKKLSDDPKKATALSLASPSGNAVKQTYVDTVTGETFVGTTDLKHGIFDDPKNKIGFHEVPADAIDLIEEACKIDGLTIDGFVPLDEIPAERFSGCYFLAPEGGPASVKPLVLLRDAMIAEKVAGVGKLTLRTSEKPFVIYAEGDALYLITLMYAGDCAARVAEAQQALAGFTADEKTLGLARTLVQAQMLDREAIDAYADESRERKSELIMAAAQGEAIEVPEHAEASAPMVDLEAALVASIGQTASKKKKPAAKKTAAAAAA